MELVTQRLKIRNFIDGEESDAYAYLSSSKVMRYIEPPYTMEDTKRLIKECGIEKQLIYAVVENESGSMIGHVIFHPFDEEKEYEIGWILSESVWGKGYASELSNALIAYAFTQKNAVRVVAETVKDNQKATHILLKLGMHLNEKRSGTYLKLYELNNRQEKE